MLDLHFVYDFSALFEIRFVHEKLLLDSFFIVSIVL